MSATATTFDALPDRVLTDLTSELRARRARVAGSVLEAIQRAAPRDEGHFAASFQVFGGSPSHGFNATGPAREQSREEAVRTVAATPLDAVVGIATAAPYARRLAHHGHSRQVHRAWLPAAIRDGIDTA